MSKAEAPNGLAKFGLLGLGVMGQNLALNIERNGYPIAVWTRKPEGHVPPRLTRLLTTRWSELGYFARFFGHLLRYSIHYTGSIR